MEGFSPRRGDINNPILEATDEAYKVYGADAQIRAIVSIGTGKSERTEPRGNLVSIIRSVTDRVTNTEAKHEEFLQNRGLSESYFRIQEPGDLGKIDLTAADRLKDIEQLAKDYII